MSLWAPALVEIPVSRAQSRIIRPALNWVAKHDGTENWTEALTNCCGDALNYLAGPHWPLIVIPTRGPTVPFRYTRDPDIHGFINEAIGIANEDIGLDDDGAALAHVTATFILTRPEIAHSRSRKMRALRTRLLQLHFEAKAAQGGGKP